MIDWPNALLWCVLQVTVLCVIALGAQWLLCRRSRSALISFVALVAVAATTFASLVFQPRWSGLPQVVGYHVAGGAAIVPSHEARPVVPARSGPEPVTDRGRRRSASTPAASRELRREVAIDSDGGATASDPVPDSFIASDRVGDVQPVTSPAPIAASGDSSVRQPSSHRSNALAWPHLLAAVILAACALGAIRLLLGLAALVTLVRSSLALDDDRLGELVAELSQRLGLRRPVSLCESSSLSTAATLSWPATILLPTEWRAWDDDTLRAVLAHELAHIKRRDFSRWVVAQCSLVMHYYHPLVHYLASKLRLQQELGADALASEAVGDRNLYRNSLARLALAQPDRSLPRLARTFLPRGGTIVRRIEMLDQPTVGVSFRHLRQSAALAVICLVAVMVVGWRDASRRALAQSPSPESAASGTNGAPKGSARDKGKRELPWESLLDGVWRVEELTGRAAPGATQSDSGVSRFSLAFSDGRYFLLETQPNTGVIQTIEQGRVSIERRDGPLARLSFVPAGSNRRSPVWCLAITDERIDVMLTQRGKLDFFFTVTLAKCKTGDPAVKAFSEQDKSKLEPPADSTGELFERLTHGTTKWIAKPGASYAPVPISASLQTRCARCHDADWKSRRLSLSYVPVDSVFIAAFRASKLLDHPVGQEFARRFKIEPLGDRTARPMEDVRQLTLLSLAWDLAPEKSLRLPETSAVVFHLKRPYSEEETLEAFRPIVGETRKQEVGHHRYWKSAGDSTALCLWRSVDGKTLILGMDEPSLLRALAAGPEKASDPRWLEKSSRYLAQSLVPGAVGRNRETLADFHAWFGLSSYFTALPDGTPIDSRIVADLLVYVPFFRSFSKELFVASMKNTDGWQKEVVAVAAACHDGVAVARLGRETIHAAASLYTTAPNQILPSVPIRVVASPSGVRQELAGRADRVRPLLASLFRQGRMALTGARTEVSRRADQDTLVQLRSLDDLERMLDSVTAPEGGDEDVVAFVADFPVETFRSFLGGWRLIKRTTEVREE